MNVRILHFPVLALLALFYFSQSARAYRDLETGTFLTRDPAGFVDGPNVYCYVRQNPWTMFDPEGLSPAWADPRSLPNCPPTVRTALDQNDRNTATSGAKTFTEFVAGYQLKGTGPLQSDMRDWQPRYQSEAGTATRAGEVARDVVGLAELFGARGSKAPKMTQPSGQKSLIPAMAGGAVPSTGQATPAVGVPIPIMPLQNFSSNEKPGGPSARDISEAANKPVPLKRLHSDKTLENDPTSSMESQRTRSTEEIIKSLEPGAKEPLRVKADGTIMDGNTRQKVLEERGVNTNRLPRTEWKETQVKEPWQK